MKLERWGETILGLVVVVVAVGFFVFASAQAGQGGNAGATYDVTARFQRVDGIAVGSDVRVSGVKVGVVRAIDLDPSTYLAKMTLSVQKNVQLLDQTTARIASDGLLGGAYVALEPAGMDPIPPGGEIINTQGSVDLLTVLSSALSNSQSSSQSGSQQPHSGATQTP
jgi:phospholipid/cholesterol/gamma-HCH transport system substrate-binding protein